MYSRRIPSVFSWLFGKKLTPKEMLQRNQRALKRAVREAERERVRLEHQEKKAIQDIKTLAKDGQIGTLTVLAKELVRTRHYIQKFILMKANLEAVQVKILTMQSQHGISEAIVAATIALRAMNGQFRLPQMERILKEFERQSVIMGVKEDMMTSTVEDAVCDPEEDFESQAVIAQVFDELGLQLSDQLNGLPEAKGGMKKSSAVALQAPFNMTSTMNNPSIDAYLENRLANLRK